MVPTKRAKRLMPCVYTPSRVVSAKRRAQVWARSGAKPSLRKTPARVCCTSAKGMRFMVGQTAEPGPLFLQRHRDFARVAALGSDHNLARGALADALELVAPLHHHQRVGSQQIVEAERLQLALAFKAVNVQMIKLDRLALARAVVFM